MDPSRTVPIGYEDSLRGSFGADLERMNRQMRRMNENYNSMVPAIQHQPVNISLNEAFRMDNPIVVDKDRNKRFYLEFDLRQFKPEEINVTTSNNVLTVHARHEEKGADGRTSYREYRRQYTIPDGVNAETLTSKLGPDGVLTIEAPVQDVTIPITHN